MISDTDLHQQPDTLQQPPLMKGKSNPIWKVMFNLLLIVNLLFGGWVGTLIILSALPFPNNYSGFGAFVFAGYYLLILAPIDLIAILFYGRPSGKLRVLTYTALILVILPFIVYFVILLIVLYFGRFIF